MNEQNTTKQPVTNEELRAAFGDGKPQRHEVPEPKQVGKHHNKVFITLTTVGCVMLVAGVAMLVCSFFIKPKTAASVQYPDLTKKGTESATYSALTGEQLTTGMAANAPAYCIQTPNGTDGARPQAGLNTAGVVFEAIAEAGITRFAAIYQNPTSSIIGPIRSLRIYYLQWDTPFDCTIVHAGGSGDALAAVSAGGYKDLSEDYNYMYRGTYGGRLWNNLFTTSSALARFSADRGYSTSEIHGFPRMTPDESKRARVDELATEKLNIVQPADGDTSALKPAVSEIALNLGGWADFNVLYHYDTTTNTYLRSYASGAAHEVYNCPAEDLGERNPEDVCSLVQMAPSVVVAMVVNERRAADNYHEDIDVIGSGDAYVFQNGTATKGTWTKSSTDSQILFANTDGAEIKLAPGQTFLTAVPSYGSVAF